MRKALFAVAALSALSLPSCIFAIGTDKDHWDDGMVTSDECNDCEQAEHLQTRVALIEHHLKGECKADCPYCKKPEAKAEMKADAAKTEVKPAKP